VVKNRFHVPKELAEKFALSVTGINDFFRLTVYKTGTRVQGKSVGDGFLRETVLGGK
jgi:hypothetical protein